MNKNHMLGEAPRKRRRAGARHPQQQCGQRRRTLCSEGSVPGLSNPGLTLHAFRAMEQNCATQKLMLNVDTACKGHNSMSHSQDGNISQAFDR